MSRQSIWKPKHNITWEETGTFIFINNDQYLYIYKNEDQVINQISKCKKFNWQNYKVFYTNEKVPLFLHNQSFNYQGETKELTKGLLDITDKF
jgi:hypothetical protein